MCTYVLIKPGLEVLFNEAIKPLGQFLIQFIADISRRFLSRFAAFHFVFVAFFYSIYFNRVVCGLTVELRRQCGKGVGGEENDASLSFKHNRFIMRLFFL